MAWGSIFNEPFNLHDLYVLQATTSPVTRRRCCWLLPTSAWCPPASSRAVWWTLSLGGMAQS